jgi:hypothetical protein
VSEAVYYSREEANLSVAWARAFSVVSGKYNQELSPFLVSITGFQDGTVVEDEELRQALDASLDESGHQSIETVANTIFPESLWRRSGRNRTKLMEQYLENLPDYVAMEPRKNRCGLYFARLIAFDLDPATGDRLPHIPVEFAAHKANQLEFVIRKWQGGLRRRGMFQASVFDPVRDHTGAARQPFPCLQHISLVPDARSGTLGLNAFYATQQLFVKAYGNWLGLARLGLFLAHEMGLRFDRLTCFAGIEKMDQDQRPRSGPLLERLKDLARATLRVADAEQGMSPAEVLEGQYAQK